MIVWLWMEYLPRWILGLEGARDNQLVHHQVVNKRAVGEEFDVLVGGGIRKGNRREFQVGSFGGITGGKSGANATRKFL